MSIKYSYGTSIHKDVSVVPQVLWSYVDGILFFGPFVNCFLSIV